MSRPAKHVEKTGNPQADRAASEQRDQKRQARQPRTTRGAVATRRATRRPSASATTAETPSQWPAPDAPAKSTKPGTAVEKAASAQPATTATPKRQPPVKASRPVADETVRKELARRLATAKDAGWTRVALSQHLTLPDGTKSEYCLWRFQAPSNNGYADHADAVAALLDRIESGELAAPVSARAERVAAGPTKAELQRQLDAVRSLLDGVAQSSAKSVTAKEKTLASRALAVLGE